MPPAGRAEHREQREAGGAAPGVRLAEVVDASEELRQVEEHRHEAAEGEEVNERQRPRASGSLRNGARESPIDPLVLPGGAASRARQAKRAPTTATTASRDPERRRETPRVRDTQAR